MTHQIGSSVSPGYVDKRRRRSDDFESRIVTGPVVYTANAGGTTTTLVGAASALNTGVNVMRLDDEFKLFTAAGVLKEETVFRVTAIAATGTTITFTPAAAVATISTDTAKLVGNQNLTATGEKDRRLVAIGFTAARVATLTENDKDFQLRVSDDPGSL